jgi:hypothetical protein
MSAFENSAADQLPGCASAHVEIAGRAERLTARIVVFASNSSCTSPDVLGKTAALKQHCDVRASYPTGRKGACAADRDFARLALRPEVATESVFREACVCRSRIRSQTSKRLCDEFAESQRVRIKGQSFTETELRFRGARFSLSVFNATSARFVCGVRLET